MRRIERQVNTNIGDCDAPLQSRSANPPGFRSPRKPLANFRADVRAGLRAQRSRAAGCPNAFLAASPSTERPRSLFASSDRVAPKGELGGALPYSARAIDGR